MFGPLWGYCGHSGTLLRLAKNSILAGLSAYSHCLNIELTRLRLTRLDYTLLVPVPPAADPLLHHEWDLSASLQCSVQKMCSKKMKSKLKSADFPRIQPTCVSGSLTLSVDLVHFYFYMCFFNFLDRVNFGEQQRSKFTRSLCSRHAGNRMNWMDSLYGNRRETCTITPAMKPPVKDLMD